MGWCTAAYGHVLMMLDEKRGEWEHIESAAQALRDVRNEVQAMADAVGTDDDWRWADDGGEEDDEEDDESRSVEEKR